MTLRLMMCVTFTMHNSLLFYCQWLVQKSGKSSCAFGRHGHICKKRPNFGLAGAKIQHNPTSDYYCLSIVDVYI